MDRERFLRITFMSLSINKEDGKHTPAKLFPEDSRA